MIYGLEDRPPVRESIFAAIQHVFACFVGIITPALIISGAIGLDPADAAYIVSMSLFVSGVATFIQAKRIGPIGSGLLSIQGTSFAFIGPIIAAGTAVTGAGGTPQQALGTIFGLCFFGLIRRNVFEPIYSVCEQDHYAPRNGDSSNPHRSDADQCRPDQYGGRVCGP